MRRSPSSTQVRHRRGTFCTVAERTPPTLGYLGTIAYTAAVLLDGTQVDLVTTAAGQVVSPAYVVEVTNGELTVELQGAGSNSLAAMEGLQILPLLFDMGPANQPVYTGAVPVSTTTSYSAAQGYGWTSDAGASAVDYTGVSGSTALTEDAVYGPSLTFQVNLPNGWYDVTPSLGDLGASSHLIGVYLQGAYLNNLPTVAGQVVSPTFLADVTGGQLTLEVTGEGSDGEAFLEGLAIAPADAPYQFDMGPSVNAQSGYGAVPAGVGSDTALGFSMTGSGTYGTVDRGTVAGATPMNETADYGQSLTFAMSLPNGSYLVIPTLGDVGNYAHTALVYLQGTQVDTVSTAGDQIVSPSYVVTVSNGLLALGLSGSAANGGDGYAVIEGLEVIPLQFDMGQPNQVVAPGYTPVSNFTWQGASQPYYGLTAFPNGNALDRGMVPGSTPVTRDAMYAGDMTFQFDLPNGWYDVTPTLGDIGGGPHGAGVYLQGALFDNISTSASQVVSPTYLVHVTNGEVTLELTGVGADGYAMIEGLTIVPAAAPYQFDMGPSVNDQAGYAAVSNFGWYNAALGYGWTTYTNGNVWDRSSVSGATPMDETAAFGQDLAFKMDLPNGNYEVMPTLGDTANGAHTALVYVQGTQVDTVATAGGQVVTNSYVADVTNGELTLELVGSTANGGDGYAVFEGLQVLPLQFDMGPANQQVLDGAVPVNTGTSYSTSQGYGWTSSTGAGAVDYGEISGSTSLTRDAVYGSSLTFQVNLPDGWYDVTPSIGDLGGNSHSAGVSLQGALVDIVNTSAGQVVTPTYLVHVTNGQVSLELTTSQGDAYIEGLAIAAAAAPYQFDMGPSVNDQTGYAAVSNFGWYNAALGYGWTAFSNGNEWDRSSTPGATPMDETAVYGQDIAFKMDLPDGYYDVMPTLGDTANGAHTALVYVQGTQVDTVATAGGQVVTNSYVADVTNGELTLELVGSTANGGDGYAVFEGLSIAPQSGSGQAAVQSAAIATSPTGATVTPASPPVVQGGPAPVRRPIHAGIASPTEPAPSISFGITVRPTSTGGTPSLAILGIRVITPAEIRVASLAPPTCGEGGATPSAPLDPPTNDGSAPISAVVDRAWMGLAATRARSLRIGLWSWIEEL